MSEFSDFGVFFDSPDIHKFKILALKTLTTTVSEVSRKFV